MPDVKTHTRKSKAGKLIQVSQHSRAGEQKAKAPTMRTEARAVVDKPDKPKSPSAKPEKQKPKTQQQISQKPAANEYNELRKKYNIGLKILLKIVVNLGGIEKARENEQYKEFIKIMSNRFKKLKELGNEQQSENNKKEIQQ